jgi:8-oxo-dGTP diphosphatase
MMHVAVGIIFNTTGEILIAQRPADKYKGGLWEFPGGKVEANETGFAALQRELQEELGILVIAAEPWLQFQHDYTDRVVLLDVFKVTEFSGDPHGKEGQPIQWVSFQELDGFEFPAGNHVILARLLARDS